MPFQSALINVMTNAVRKAANGLRRDFGELEHLQVSKKDPTSFASAAGTRANQILRRELQRARPEFSFYSENQCVSKDAGTQYTWLIDSLDGSTNFLHSIPHFCLSIALEKNRDIVAGTVYDPLRDEMFWAEKGDGAFLNGRRLRVSARHHIDKAVVATGVSNPSRADHGLFMRQLRKVITDVYGIRRSGSSALDLAYVAAGRYEGFWENYLMRHTIAAGIILVREAGGFVTEIDGGGNTLETGSILAANDHLHVPLGVFLRAASVPD